MSLFPKLQLPETDYQFGYGFSGYLNVMHVADEYYYSRNLPLQKARLEAYTLLNMKLNYSFLMIKPLSMSVPTIFSMRTIRNPMRYRKPGASSILVLV
ncbi:MAG: hypothetical protein IBX56_16690 [Methylomicrobium sp.]|nr:hypothetical protein [Methylomicrobium sp.]